jgi:adenosylcobinamide-phosphate synthase
MTQGLLALALALDLAVGDPDSPAHPVRRIGALVRWTEGVARRKGGRLRLRGTGLALFVVGLSYLAGLVLLKAAGLADAGLGLRGWLTLGIGALIVWSTLAVRSMLDHAVAVLAALELGDLSLARLAVARMVGRDCSELDERGVCRALLETIAEGLGDGVIGPLFFAFLGGPALALAYRAANTLDSMVGYKDEHYAEMGWASAKLDDVLSWLPARKAALFTMMAAVAMRLDPVAAWTVARRDARRQPSPNSGWPEGAFAGALGVQLGGPLKYRGRLVEKATLGEPRLPLSPERCRRGLTLFMVASVFAAAVYEVTTWFHSHCAGCWPPAGGRPRRRPRTCRCRAC